MSEQIHIKDPFGHSIPLQDAYGNLSFDVMLLYSEDKLTEADRAVVDELAAADPMTKDALEGFVLSENPSKTQFYVNQLHRELGGKKPIHAYIEGQMNYSDTRPFFTIRRMAATVAVLIVVASATYFTVNHFRQDQLADANTGSKNELSRSDAAQQGTMAVAESESDSSTSYPVHDITGNTAENDESVPVSDDIQSKKSVENVPVLAEKNSADKKLEPSASGESSILSEEKTANEITDGLITEIQDDAPSQTDDLASNADTQTPRDNAILEPEPEEVAMDKEITVNEETASSRMNDRSAAVARQEQLQSTVARETEAKQQSMASLSKKMEVIEDSGANNAGLSADSEETSLEAEAESMMPARAGAAASIETEAQFVGGQKALQHFIDKRKNYTEAMKQQGLKGIVEVSFDVNSDGRIGNAKIKSGVDGLIDTDALRIVRSMPKWRPAMKNGTPVRSSHTVTVQYGF